MPLIVNRKLGQPLRLTTPEGVVVLVTVNAGHQPGEVKITVDAPRSVVVTRPEAD